MTDRFNRRVTRIATPIFLGVVALSAMTLQAQDTADTPRLPSGKPDFNGVWFGGFQLGTNARTDGHSICLGNCPEIEAPSGGRPGGPPGGLGAGPDRPQYKPEFQAEVDRLNEFQVREDPVLNCGNPGVPRIGIPDKIVQTESEVVFLYDDVNGSFYRIVPLDGRGHRSDVEDTFLGDSIGWWEGDTLVVETVNFNDKTWLTDDGSFHTTNLRVVERLTRNGDELTWQATAHDPDVLVEPWEKRPVTGRLTDVELYESPPCIERDLPLMQDLSNHDNPR